MAGMDMLFKTLADTAMKNLPPEVLQQIGQIGQVVAGFKSQLDRIEAKLDAMEKRADTPPEQQKVLTDGQST